MLPALLFSALGSLVLAQDPWTQEGTDCFLNMPQFNCSKVNASQSLGKLSPADIGAVASLGDSVIAGLHMQRRRRDTQSWSFSGGDDPSTVSIANLLKYYNSDLKTGRQWNFALSQVSLVEQAKRLIKIHNESMWTVVNVVTGMRQLCNASLGNSIADAVRHDVTETLVLLNTTSRMKVNLIAYYPLDRVPHLAKGNIACSLAQHKSPCPRLFQVDQVQFAAELEQVN